jgi:uncharacterized protein (TIGR03086 family)
MTGFGHHHLVMTNITSAVKTASLDHDDPRAIFARAVGVGTTVISAVTPAQFDASTPCTEYDVRQLLGHLIGVLSGVAALGRGDDPSALEPPVVDDSPVDAWLAAAHRARNAWDDPATLTRTITMPWAALPGGEMLAVYVNEVVIHTWDLAKATGQSPEWDRDVLQRAFDAIRATLPAEGRMAMYDELRKSMPEAQRNFTPPFADVVPLPKGAPLLDRLVAYNGRRP